MAIILSIPHRRMTQVHRWPTQVSRYQNGKKQSGFYWSKREWVAVASDGAYASLHLAPDRWPRQHPTTQFFTGRMPFLPPNQQRQSTEGICHAAINEYWLNDCSGYWLFCRTLLTVCWALPTSQRGRRAFPRAARRLRSYCASSKTTKLQPCQPPLLTALHYAKTRPQS